MTDETEIAEAEAALYTDEADLLAATYDFEAEMDCGMNREDQRGVEEERREIN